MDTDHEQRMNTEKKKTRHIMGGIQCWRCLLGGRYILCRQYFLVGIQCWRCFWAVSCLSAVLLAGAVFLDYGGIFCGGTAYGGIFWAVGGFSFFGGIDSVRRYDRERRYFQIKAVNRQNTVTANQGGIFTTGKIQGSPRYFSRHHKVPPWGVPVFSRFLTKFVIYREPPKLVPPRNEKTGKRRKKYRRIALPSKKVPSDL